jgi:hypothetical protein
MKRINPETSRDAMRLMPTADIGGRIPGHDLKVHLLKGVMLAVGENQELIEIASADRGVEADEEGVC